MYTISQIAQIIKADWLQQNRVPTIEHILLDSRKLLFPTTSLFFALGGPRRNGNSFIDELYKKEVRNFVIDEAWGTDALMPYEDANFYR